MDHPVLKIQLADVLCVYVGKPGVCRCGCAGTYTYLQANAVAASKDRGYEVTEDEINDTRIARVLKKVQKAVLEGAEIEQDTSKYSQWFDVVIGKTTYTIYRLLGQD